MKTTAEYLSILRNFYICQAANYGITRMGIFGSVARGEQTEGSDVDICYEGTPPTLLVLDRLQSELRALFGCPVDMVRLRDTMNQYLKEQINREAIYV